MDNLITAVLITLLSIVFALCALTIFFFGLYYLFSSLYFLIHRKKFEPADHLPIPTDWPRVSVQLPISNEGKLVERLLTAVTGMVYPRDRLQIQVMDDSTDATSELLKSLVAKYQAEGFDIQYLKRGDRTGFKAGNLAHGLQHATGELIAILDADSVPEPMWLKKVVPSFQDPRLGFVQTHSTQINGKHNLITRLQTMALDAFFAVEYPVRNHAGLFQGFSGSAGVWRKESIISSGGWQWDTLTEDLDMSVRAQVNGWKAKYIPYANVEAEVPALMDSLKRQQYRWAKGHIQVFRKLSWKVLTSPNLPFLKRVEGVGRFALDFSFIATLVMLLLALPIGRWVPSLFIFWAWTFLAGIGAPLYYSIARSPTFPRLWERIFLLPGLALLGIGLSFSCGFAALSGLLMKGGVFLRTPKGYHQHVRDGRKRFLSFEGLFVVGEIVMGVYLMTTVWSLLDTVGLVMAPWLLSSACGFFMMAAFSIWQYWLRPKPVSEPQPPEDEDVIP